MAIKHSAWANGQKAAPVSREANGLVVERFTFTITEDLASGDIVELAVLPAYHYPVDAVLVSGALGASVTVDIGIMSGDVGSPDSNRTSGDELFDGLDVAAAAVTRLEEAGAFSIQSTDRDRSIGLKVNAAVTASNQEITLVLTYAQ